MDPADFTALWEACTRCFYLAVASGFPRPRADAPLITPLLNRISAGLALAEPDDTEATAIVHRLHAYAHALERDDTVAGLGLLCF